MNIFRKPTSMAGACYALLFIVAAQAGGAHKCSNPKKSKEPVSLLIVTGGHPYEPSEFFAAFQAMSGVRFQHVYLMKAKPVSYPQGGLGRYDVVLFYDMEEGEIIPEWRSLLDRGKSLIFLHHAIGSFPESPEFEAIAGGHANFTRDVFPEVANTTFHHNELQRFSVTDPVHPITCGIGDFDMLEEAYDNFDVQPGAHILLTSSFPQTTPAAAWTWSFEGKRVVFLQPGHGVLGLPPDHGPSSYQSEPFKRLLHRSILWAGGRL